MRPVYRPAGHCYEVGGHLLRVWRAGEGWAASVDGLSPSRVYPTEALAWEGGVRLLDELDAPASASRPAPAT